MDQNEMLGWVKKHCKFAAVPIPGTESPNQLEHAVRDTANRVLQFMNQSKKTGHGEYDVNQFMLKTVNEAARGMGMNPAQTAEFMETVKDAVGAHAGAGEPSPRGMGTPQPPAGAATPFQGARNAPTSPPPTRLPGM